MRASFERLGNVSYQQGKLEEAEKYYDRALSFDRSVHDPMGSPATTET